ncbi:gp53-like domain-containing protein [Paludibacterium paludis]|uniref:Putative tail fiber protein gp53-like C-terminal domain-containing protein n=1 Tax=Paludibacterium paludis TaxID=1225769 RepID=A0A918NZS4_9NEIS|nr:hypothetical protein [Paludibacterium paludis]GGY07035.1 hypothetical protein GCM10011289_07050 [Paludibacterium paludis]
MRRETIYPGQILPETTLLNMGRDTLAGMGRLMQDIFGGGPAVAGFACTPTAPASLQVNIAPGSIYTLQPLEATAWSTMGADTGHTTVKQGLQPEITALTITPPAVVGMAINYLVQVAYQDQDINPMVLPYYNSQNPNQPFTGQGNNGQSQATARDGVAVVSLKAGIAAASGSQQTPAPDSGNVGLWVITVLNGQTTVTNQNIAPYPNVPYLNPNMLGTTPTLLQTPPQFDKSTRVATTEFVQRALGNFQSGVEFYESTTLSASDTGKWINLASATPFTVTMPSLASVPEGAAFLIHSDSTPITHTLVATGNDRFVAAGVKYSTLPLGQGEFLIVTKAATVWRTAGTAVLKNEAQFRASFIGNGWQKLPSGLIIQWGQILVITANTQTQFKFPLTFPNATLALYSSAINSGTTVVSTDGCWFDTAIGSVVASGPNITVNWLAIGY